MIKRISLQCTIKNPLERRILNTHSLNKVKLAPGLLYDSEMLITNRFLPTIQGDESETRGCMRGYGRESETRGHVRGDGKIGLEMKERILQC